MEYLVYKYSNEFELRFFPYGIPTGNKGKRNKSIMTYEDQYKSARASISRAKRMISDYIRCNDFNYMVTWTLKEEMTPKEFQKKLSNQIRNWNTRNKDNLIYIYIFERGDNGRLHAHGVMNKIPQLYYNGKISRQKHNKGTRYLSSTLFDKIGYQSIELIRDNEATAHYITKYLIKDLFNNEFVGNRYMCSKGLNKPVVVYEGVGTEYDCLQRFMFDTKTLWDYPSKYVYIKRLDPKYFSFSDS